MLTLSRRDITHRRETIRPFRRLAFQRLLGYHAETARRFHRVVIFHRIIKGQAVPGNTAPQYGSMGREHAYHLRQGVLQIQHTASRHPLVELGYNTLPGKYMITYETLDHFSSGETKQHGLDIVTLSGQRIHLKFLPERG